VSLNTGWKTGMVREDGMSSIKVNLKEYQQFLSLTIRIKYMF